MWWAIQKNHDYKRFFKSDSLFVCFIVKSCNQYFFSLFRNRYIFFKLCTHNVTTEHFNNLQSNLQKIIVSPSVCRFTSKHIISFWGTFPWYIFFKFCTQDNTRVNYNNQQLYLKKIYVKPVYLSVHIKSSTLYVNKDLCF